MTNVFPFSSQTQACVSDATIADGPEGGPLSPAAERWFESRGISVETVVRTGIYTARRGLDGAMVRSDRGDVVVYPFIEGNKAVNEKFRGAGKKFWQREGGRKTFWNSSVMDDVALERGDYPLIITEGENDALAAIECGFPHTVSVPDGAPPARDSHGNLLPAVPDSADDVDPAHDEKYRYVTNNWDRLAKIKSFVIATDGDEPGQRLAAELVRRLGRVRCKFVTYPVGKDLNDVLMQSGRDAVRQVIEAARPYPVKGLFRLSEFPDIEEPIVYSTGWRRLDLPVMSPVTGALMVYPGAFMVVTGVPGSGKSTWTIQLVTHLARIHRWPVAIASFEMPTVPYVRDMIRAHYLGAPKQAWSYQDKQAADAWIEDNFVFIDQDPRNDTEDADINWIVDRASDAVIRHGIKVLLLDPWNEIEHKRASGESETDYTGRAIRALKRFARSYDVLVIVVAHPVKMINMKGETERPSLYHISGSANWANKADIGVVVDRPDAFSPVTILDIKKVRFRAAGQRGEITMSYDRDMNGYGD